MEIVGNIIFGSLMLNLDTLYLKEFFTLDTYLKWEHRLYGLKSYSKTFPIVYGIPYNSLGMRRYIFLCQTNQQEKTIWLSLSLQVGPKSGDINSINIG
jgi:hypothetical protein